MEFTLNLDKNEVYDIYIHLDHLIIHKINKDHTLGIEIYFQVPINNIIQWENIYSSRPLVDLAINPYEKGNLPHYKVVNFCNKIMNNKIFW